MPEQMLLVQVLSFGAAIGVLGCIVVWMRRAGNSFHHRADRMISRIDAFALANDIDPNTALDIVMDDPNDREDYNRSKLIIEQTYIGQEVNKGYDLIRSKLKKGFLAPYHSHRDSDEFFYILSGKAKVTTKHDGCMEETILEGGDYFFMTHRLSHSFEALTQVDLVTVALPPLLKE